MRNRRYFLLFITFFASCSSTWNKSKEEAFREACMDNATKWTGSNEKAATYCDCVVPKIIQKYITADAAMKHIDYLVSDTDLNACKKLIDK